MTAPDATGTPPPGSQASGGRVVVVWNRTAGRKAGLPTNTALAEEEMRELFARGGLEVDLHPTETPEEAVDLTHRAAEAGASIVVAAGGDGSVRLVAEALLEAAEGGAAGTALGILPLGSVMNVSRSLGIPRDLDGAVRILAEGHVRAIDVGETGDHTLFLEGVAIGLHAELFREGAAFDAGDRLAPLRAVWTTLRYRPTRLTLTLDDGRVVRTRALVTTVANGPFSGLAFTVAPSARLDDGRFDVRIFGGFSRLELLAHFASIVAGRRTYEPRVTTLRAASVRVESARRLRVRADDEGIGWTPVTLRVRPRALRVVTPDPRVSPPEPRELQESREP